MGMHKTCVRYKKTRTPRGSELRCVKFAKKRGKAGCPKGLKAPPRSPGLIHANTCR